MTALLLVFGCGLLLVVVTSALASRSPLSSSTVFLLAGVVAGPLALDVVSVDSVAVEKAAEVALFAVLFTDGQHAPWAIVRRHWQAPTRALVLGLPLTFLLVAALAHWLAGLDWPAALVLGAVLAPTDPVFASALVGRDDVPRRVRNMLNVESGLNDGLALPVVLLLVGAAGGSPEGWSTEPLTLAVEVIEGVALGFALPALVVLLLRVPGVAAVPTLLPLAPMAIAVILFAVTHALGANAFLAAFTAGATIATLQPRASEAFRHTGELVSEAAKGAALIAFAALLDTALLRDVGWPGLVLALAVILVARPVPVLAVLVRSRLDLAERLAVAWFGPKGFASVVYAVIVLLADMEQGQEVFALATLCVLVSVVAHSSTDVAVARRLQLTEDEQSDGFDGPGAGRRTDRAHDRTTDEE